MAKASSLGGIAGVASGQFQSPQPLWEKTPWWNIHRWFGLDLRARHLGVGWAGYNSARRGGQWWEYANSKKVARKVLSNAYGPLQATQEPKSGPIIQSSRWTGRGAKR